MMSSHGRINRRVRRTSADVHVELTPMIDVVFLLLTFFVFSLVLMIRADVLDVRLPELRSGENAERVVPITIAITETGGLVINGEQTELDAVLERVQALREMQPNAPLLLAVDTRSPAGVMIELADLLTGASLGEFSIVGRKASETIIEPSEVPQP
jgi:biopolymer transport protein ExbD